MGRSDDYRDGSFYARFFAVATALPLNDILGAGSLFVESSQESERFRFEEVNTAAAAVALSIVQSALDFNAVPSRRQKFHAVAFIE